MANEDNEWTSNGEAAQKKAVVAQRTEVRRDGRDY